MKYRYIFTGVLAAGLLFASCSDKLDIPQHSVVAIDDFYKTDTEAEEAIVTAYSQFKSCHSGGNWSLNCVSALTNFLGDEYWAGGGSRSDGNYYQLSEFTFDSGYSIIKGLYSDLYTLIYDCNLVLGRVTGDSAIMKRARAEALVMRAWANFQLVTLWGTPPLVDHVLAADEYLQPNVESPSVLWTAIETDLNDAISSGALTDQTGTYRLTKAFAQAMLGKAYLWQKKYAEAASTLGSIVNSKAFSLRADLSVYGTIKEDVSTEDLFCMRGIDDASNSGPNGTFRGIYTGLRGEKYSYGARSIFYSFEWGFLNNATKALYDKFVEVEGKDGYRVKNYILTYEDMQKEYDTKANQVIYDNEGYYDLKYMPRKDNGSMYRYPLPAHIMRYNEVLCLAAEAYFMNNDKGNAAKCINEIRNRAKAPTVSEGEVTLQLIKDESWMELCFEGLRYQNLLRWGDAKARLGERGKTHPELSPDGTVTYKSYNISTYGWKEGKHELLPFPADEIAVNPNIEQNPGW